MSSLSTDCVDQFSLHFPHDNPKRSVACYGILSTRKSEYPKILDQDFKCALSGMPFDVAANLEKEFSRNPYMPSLDRIESRGGYTNENTRVVLSALNYAINEWGLDIYKTIAANVLSQAAK